MVQRNVKGHLHNRSYSIHTHASVYWSFYR